MTAGHLREIIPKNPRLIFMGTPEFAVPALHALVEGGFKIVAVVTQPDRPKGRGKRVIPSPVKEKALACRLEVLQPNNASHVDFCGDLEALNPDLFIVIAYGQILSRGLLSVPRWGAVNIHASLLPKYRGAAPIQWAILNNEKETGLTLIEMNEGLDKGPILFYERIPIGENESAGLLHDRLAAKTGGFITRALKSMAEIPPRAVPQSDHEASYAPKIDKNVWIIDWTLPAPRIAALIRSLDPKPGAFTIWEGRKLKLFAPKVVSLSSPGNLPGQILDGPKRTLHIETGEGILEIGEMQIPGKKRVSTADFLCGCPLPKGTVFGR